MITLRFLTAGLAAVGHTLLLLVLLAVIVAAYRVATAGQIDHAARLTGKRDYLTGIGKQYDTGNNRPNIISMLFDDMRYGDIGAGAAAFSGGRVETAMAFSVPQKEWLFDLNADERESYDTADRHPARLDRLRAAYEAKVSEMEVNKRGWVNGI